MTLREDLTIKAHESVLMGNYLPAHDEVFDLAEDIAEQIGNLHAYITEVRDEAQADAAINELLGNLRVGILEK